MAERKGIWQVTGADDMTSILKFYQQNVPESLQDAVIDAAEAGASAMAARLTTATTPTGRSGYPAGRVGPGRRRTDTMYESIFDDLFNESTSASSARTTRSGNFRFEFGYLDPPSYARYQELGTSTIEPALAFQAGWNVVHKMIFETMARRAEEARDAALAKRHYSRANRVRLSGAQRAGYHAGRNG